MSPARPHCFRPRGFTLLEVMLAVAIMALVGMALYQFVSSTILAARLTDTSGALQADLAGFNRVMQAQILRLPSRPPAGLGIIAGKSSRSGALASDSVTWITPPGNGVFTRRSDGLLFATLELVRAKQGSQLVLSRAQMQPDPNVPPRPLPDVPLIANVSSLEISYYDARINSWVTDWTDVSTVPDLIRFRLQFANGAPEYETVLRLPPKAPVTRT